MIFSALISQPYMGYFSIHKTSKEDWLAAGMSHDTFLTLKPIISTTAGLSINDYVH